MEETRQPAAITFTDYEQFCIITVFGKCSGKKCRYGHKGSARCHNNIGIGLRGILCTYRTLLCLYSDRQDIVRRTQTTEKKKKTV